MRKLRPSNRLHGLADVNRRGPEIQVGRRPARDGESRTARAPPGSGPRSASDRPKSRCPARSTHGSNRGRPGPPVSADVMADSIRLSIVDYEAVRLRSLPRKSLLIACNCSKVKVRRSARNASPPAQRRIAHQPASGVISEDLAGTLKVVANARSPQPTDKDGKRKVVQASVRRAIWSSSGFSSNSGDRGDSSAGPLR